MAKLKITLLENENAKIENVLWDSSNVLKTSYNFNTQQLYVTFSKGGVYYYNGVSGKVYSDLKESSSVGSFVNKTLRTGYTAIKVGTAQEENISELLNEINTLKIKGKENIL